MCILVLSTEHPDYSLILVNNRDEYLARPTAVADFWPAPYDHVLGGRDLLRSAQGTWLGVTKDGRIACLTNYREDDAGAAEGKISRGEMVNSYLRPAPTEMPDLDTFVKGLTSGEGARGSGGFSMLCGKIAENRFCVVSNRSDEPAWVEGKDVTVGLSNAPFGDRSWPKVVNGENILRGIISDSVLKKQSEEELIAELFKLLSIDTLPPRKPGETWEAHVKELRKSIFIPVVGDADEHSDTQRSSVADVKLERVKSVEKGVNGAYATQKQTVILADHDGNVTFIERSLFGEDAERIDNIRSTRKFRFKVSGFN